MSRRTSLLVAALLTATLSAQDGSAADLDHRLRACLADGIDAATLRQGLVAYRTALGPRHGTATLLWLIEALEDSPADRRPTLGEGEIAELLERVAAHRRRGHQERMLPALRVLETLLPGDARVLYAVGEAYGVPSSVFDPAKAETAFAALFDRLLSPTERKDGEDDEAAALARFLPELGGDRDRTSWLRDRVRGCRETLRDGQAIDAFQLRDRRLEELEEDLRVVLPRGSQREIAEVFGLMREIRPDDPAICLAQAQLHASMGPLFDAERSIELHRAFLDLTAEERFAPAEPDDAPLLSRDQVAHRLLALQVPNAGDPLQQLRIAAKETMDALAPPKGKPEPMLYFPERSQLDKELKTCRRALEKDNRELDKSAAKIAQLQSELDGAIKDYEAWKQGLRGRRGVRDPQPFVDAIRSRKVSIERLEKRHAPLAEKVAAQQRWVEACEQRMARFDR